MKNQKGFILPIIIVVLAVTILGGAGYFLYKQYFAPKLVACTMEAKLCPDGSSVGRTGPNCEFAVCPDQTAGWKTYNSNNYGFQIQYPGNWYFQDTTIPGQGNANLSIHIQNNTEDCLHTPATVPTCKTASYINLSIVKIAPSVSLSSYIVDPNNIKKINIGSSQYDVGISFDNPFDPNSTQNSASYAYIIKDGYLYMIGYVSTTEKEYGNNKKIMARIASTFKFTK